MMKSIIRFHSYAIILPLQPFHIDTSPQQTLRKGWLMLRGKSDREWSKHWVVLAGLSLKLYKWVHSFPSLRLIFDLFRDVWAEDSTEPIISIDLAECENVYPSASAKNYGIEIKVCVYCLVDSSSIFSLSVSN